MYVLLTFQNPFLLTIQKTSWMSLDDLLESFKFIPSLWSQTVHYGCSRNMLQQVYGPFWDITGELQQLIKGQ